MPGQVVSNRRSGRYAIKSFYLLLLSVMFIFVICWAVGGHVLKLKFVPILKYEKEWSIAIYTGRSPFDLAAPSDVANPVLTAGNVKDIPAQFVSDPFMIKKGPTWYMFFEVLDRDTELGSIAFATSSDGRSWKYEKIVIHEPFHLSYPYVFEWQNEYYMVPESANDSSIRLYKAVDFPQKWVHVANLATGKDFVDNSLVRHDGKWWLFTQTGDFHNGNVSIYYADNLEGPWTEHPLNPVVRNQPHNARGGGRVISYGGKLFRFAQDDSPYYGLKSWAMEIEQLTTASYSEKRLRDTPVVQAGSHWWNSEGMHTVDPHQVGDDQWIACVDGYRWRWLFVYNRRMDEVSDGVIHHGEAER